MDGSKREDTECGTLNSGPTHLVKLGSTSRDSVDIYSALSFLYYTLSITMPPKKGQSKQDNKPAVSSAS
jgi:hypothetical protein